jgi:D-alanyl-D-alanine carboxypeptidase
MKQVVSRRLASRLLRFASCLLVASFVIPADADAQSVSSKMRAPTRAHGKAIRIKPTGWVPHPAITDRDSHLVVDAATGRELAEDRSEELRHPASLAKLMTIYMTFTALDSGKLALGDLMPVSANAANAFPTKMGVPLGGTVSVRDAVMGLITRSANDAAVVLAEALAGDETSFARQMTQKARELGMSATVFRNASGLPDREQVTSARDMVRLAQALLRDFPHYYPVFSVQTYNYRGRPMENHNRMLASFAGADGFKTGYTNASGFNLVMSAQRDGRRLIGVVMGGQSAFARDRLMAELMNGAFNRADQMNLAGFAPPPTSAGARYAAAHFAPNAAIPAPVLRSDTVAFLKAPSPAALPKPAAVPTPASLAGFAPAPPAMAPSTKVSSTEATAPTIGSWVMQFGSFGNPKAAMQALDRASAALPDGLRGRGAASVDEVNLANKTFHRARLTNLRQEEALDGCKQLEKRKITCAPVQVTALNTPAAR